MMYGSASSNIVTGPVPPSEAVCPIACVGTEKGCGMFMLEP